MYLGIDVGECDYRDCSGDITDENLEVAMEERVCLDDMVGVACVIHYGIGVLPASAEVHST